RDSAGKDLARTDGKLEVIDNELLDAPASRLLTDAFTDIGARLGKLAQEAQIAGRAEILIEVHGLRDYSVFRQTRESLSSRLHDDGGLEEREVARGRAVFALVTARSPDQVKAHLSGLRVGGQSLALKDGDSGGAPILMEFR